MPLSKRKGLQKKKQSNRIWEIVEDIKNHKSGTLLDDPRYKKDFNKFLALRALSMNPDLIEFVNFANQYQGVLDDNQMYDFLIKFIPKTKHRSQWVKSNFEENVKLDKIMDYFDCNRREANMYLELYGEKWAKEVEESFGGFR